MTNKLFYLAFRYISIIIFLILTFFIFTNNEFDPLLNYIYNIRVFEATIIILLLMVRPITDSLRWFLFTKIVCDISFFKIHEATIKGYSLNLIGNTSLGLETSKILIVKNKIGYQNSFFLFIIERLTALSIKAAIILSSILIYLNIYYDTFDYGDKIIYLLFGIIISFFIIIKSKFFKQLFGNFNFKVNKIYFDLIKKKVFSIFFITTLCQIYNIILYICIFYLLGLSQNFLSVSIIVPLIELFSQIAIFFPAAQELSTIFLFSQFKVPLEYTILIALIYRIGDLFSIAFHSIYIEVIYFLKKNNSSY